MVGWMIASMVETEENLADIDLDDHKGFQRVADVLKLYIPRQRY